MSRRRFSSNTVRTVGALLPSDVLAKAVAGEGLEGLDEESYGLDGDVRMREAVTDAWNEARSLWWRFLSELRDLPESDVTGTTLTRERWLIPLLELLGFHDIEVLASSITVGKADYPISHIWNGVPLHLMGARLELDSRKTAIPGAARLSPHSLTQQFLNRSGDHLWGIVSNGYRLRILRDSVSLTRQAFVEFDLEAMFNGEVFVDFALLYRVAHATRFDGERPEDCLLERWIAAARDEGIRALDQLREGVESALTTLGTGFLRHPDNADLRASVDSGDLDAKGLYRYLLRLVYRLLFLFVAEDRDLLLVPDTDPAVRERYDRFYSTARLRELASLPTGSGHGDLWTGLTSLMHVLGRDKGEPALGLPGLGSFLWAHDSIGRLVHSGLDNEDLLDALQGLAYVDEGGALRRIDFAGMGAEELGSVYESLLELHPSFGDDRDFLLGGGAGSERKTTGSYYTPTELIVELLHSALDPVLEEAASKDDAEKAILELKIVDPAVGSGHFLVAAAHRIAKRLAEVRTGEPEPPEDEYRHAVRDVVSRCLFAVDVNDLAVELCKVSLWLEALEPGKPLSFLDHHILVGNSLFGATPAAIADGIPDDAFQVLTGDDRQTVAELKKRNQNERSGQDGLPFEAGDDLTSLVSEMQTLEDFDDEDLETVRAKERMLVDWKSSNAYKKAKLVADTWCAAFAIEKTATAPALTDSAFRRVRDEGRLPETLHERVDSLVQEYSFFHWHLAFPQVFGSSESDANGAGWSRGFDVVLGNPPWERVRFDEREALARLVPELAKVERAAERRSLVKRRLEQDATLSDRYNKAQRSVEAVSAFLRRSGEYPLCGVGRDINLAFVFAELGTKIVSPVGAVGYVLPSEIATGATASAFFASRLSSKTLASFFDFENRNGLFPGVDRRYRFGLMTLSGTGRQRQQAEFVFLARRVRDLQDLERQLRLSAADISMINPNTGNCPVVRSQRDCDLLLSAHRTFPVLRDRTNQRPGSWRFQTRPGLYHMGNDAGLFVPFEELNLSSDSGMWKPLYEAKMAHIYDHRWATWTGERFEEVPDAMKEDPAFSATPRYFVPTDETKERARSRTWHLGYRDVTNATNERTVIPCVLPDCAVSGTVTLVDTRDENWHALLAMMASFPFDYIARQKVGGTHLTVTTFEQLPAPGPPQFSEAAGWDRDLTLSSWLRPRVAELILTAADVQGVGNLGNAVFRFDPFRRIRLRAELDAAFFHIYGIGRDDLDYVMESFPIVKRKEIAAHGSYRTKELILDVHDRMAKAIETGRPYRTILDPPAADPSLRVTLEPAG